MTAKTDFPMKRSKRRAQKPEAPLRHWVSGTSFAPDALGDTHTTIFSAVPAPSMRWLWGLVLVLIGLGLCAGFSPQLGSVFLQEQASQGLIFAILNSTRMTALFVLLTLGVSVLSAVLIGGASVRLMTQTDRSRSRIFHVFSVLLPLCFSVPIGTLFVSLQGGGAHFIVLSVCLGVLMSADVSLSLRSRVWQLRSASILAAAQTIGVTPFAQFARYTLPILAPQVAPSILRTALMIFVSELLLGFFGLSFASGLGEVIFGDGALF